MSTTVSPHIAVAGLALSLAASASLGQNSEVRTWWNTAHDGWTGSFINAWMFFGVSEGPNVTPDPSRDYSVTWSSGSAVLNRQPDDDHAYWSESYTSEAALIASWHTQDSYSFAADGDIQGSAGPVLGAAFAFNVPSIDDPSRLTTINPGDIVDISAPGWSAGFITNRSTWISIRDVVTDDIVWSATPSGDDGIATTLDTSMLLTHSEYELRVTYSSRFLSDFDGSVLGDTSVISGFDRTTVYSFTTIPAPGFGGLAAAVCVGFGARRGRRS